MSFDDLKAVWLFAPGRRPTRISDAVLPIQASRVTASLLQNPQLVSQLAFSPRPVLVEGPTDSAAFKVALARLADAEVVAQTELIDCGGSGSVGVWLEICTTLGIDVKAVADLDSVFDPGVQRTLNALPGLADKLVQTFASGPGHLHAVLEPIIRAADAAGVSADPASRADWLRQLDDTSLPEVIRRDRVLTVLKEHGLWLHLGNLEQVLGIASKGVAEAARAAETPSAIDEAALWAAYELDLQGDVEILLNVAVERVAHAIMEAERAGPTTEFRAPVGGSALADARLVRVEPVSPGRHRITVLAPAPFVDYWLEFTRSTPSTQLCPYADQMSWLVALIVGLKNRRSAICSWLAVKAWVALVFCNSSCMVASQVSWSRRLTFVSGSPTPSAKPRTRPSGFPITNILSTYVDRRAPDPSRRRPRHGLTARTSPRRHRIKHG